ncbi:PqqD family protein [Kribbia dieselivorans]|uniref:PqqD family protein n=1 Tax=Kribbia dieselivorans TaxID=331526 RepID=UPI00083921A7|nr:PqqD family protein [Kribbia dieselivorans]
MTRHISPDVAIEWSGDQVWVALLPAGPLVGFTGSGALIWSLLEEGGDTDLVTRTAVEAGVEPSVVEADVTEFLRQCTDLGLLTRG